MSMASTSTHSSQSDSPNPLTEAPADSWTGHLPDAAPEHAGVPTVAEIKRPTLDRHSAYGRPTAGTGKPYSSAKVVVPRVRRPTTDDSNLATSSVVGHPPICRGRLE
ncbi:hypothetical protein HWV62_4297 [Athelia sp. TMB]|nr:hypothetical protein HWV62_4297 [Athelia sp. TMB]